MENVENPWTKKVVIPPERGKIVDRNIKLLAFNIPTITVVADPHIVENKPDAASKLSLILGATKRELLKMMNESGKYVVLARKQPFEVRERIEKLNLAGVKCEIAMTRKYPQKNIASQLLGFTDVDGVGISGLEKSLDYSLRGVPGKMLYQKTATNDFFNHPDYPIIPPENGQDVVLSIDYRYQHIAEEELLTTINTHKAEGGVAVIMNPKTGEVLAMASEPGFDPNHANQYDASCWRLRPITDAFEPGSTFKLVLMSAVLNEGLHTPDDLVFCENGKYELMDVRIPDTSPHAWLTLREVLVYSSNIGVAKLAMDIDKRTLYEYARAYGFGNRYDFDIIGEREGILKPVKDWSGVTPAFMSIGHEITATSLQMCNMFCAVANGGYLLSPSIIKEIRKDGQTLVKTKPKVIRKVISSTTADTLKNIMRDVVIKGTGTNAQIAGMNICGKTGTAQMAYTTGNRVGYQKNNYIASFGGFFPEEDPKLVIFVMVEKPRVGYYGGTISAPCFKRIAERIIDIEGRDYFIKSDDDLENSKNDGPVVVPNLVGTTRDYVNDMVVDEHFIANISGSGDVILSQDPKPGTELQEAKELFLSATDTKVENDSTVPDVTGLPLRNALNVLSLNGISVVVEGSGKVVKQTPKAGSTLKNKEQVLLHCETAINLKDLIVMN